MIEDSYPSGSSDCPVDLQGRQPLSRHLRSTTPARRGCPRVCNGGDRHRWPQGGTTVTARRLFLAVAATAALSGIAVGAVSAGGARTSEGCGNKLVFLVWPKGHAAIPRIAEFPEIRNPHIEVYRGFNSGYDVAAAGAWVIGGKPPPGITRGGFFTACANYGDEVTKGTVAGPRVTITKETAVKCILPGSPVTDVVLRRRRCWRPLRPHRRPTRRAGPRHEHKRHTHRPQRTMHSDRRS